MLGMLQCTHATIHPICVAVVPAVARGCLLAWARHSPKFNVFNRFAWRPLSGWAVS